MNSAEDFGFTAADVQEWLACSADARERVWMRSGFFARRVEEVAGSCYGYAQSVGGASAARGQALAQDKAERLSIAGDAVLEALRTAKPHDPVFGGKPVHQTFAEPEDLLRYVRFSTKFRARDSVFDIANQGTSLEDLGNPEKGLSADEICATTKDPTAPQNELLTPEEKLDREQQQREVRRLVDGFGLWLAAGKGRASQDHFRKIREALGAVPWLVLGFLFHNACHMQVVAWFRENTGDFNQDTYGSRTRRLRILFAEYEDTLKESEQSDLEEWRDAMAGVREKAP